MNWFFSALNILSIIVFFSCKGADSGIQSVSTSDFPTSVGSTWKYAIYDSITRRPDTVVVSITDSTFLSDGTAANVWRYDYLHSVDSQCVVRAGDSILVYRSPDVRSLSMVLVLPLGVGREWTTVPPGSMKVASLEKVKLRGESLPAFRVVHHPFIGNFYGGTTYWFASGLGLVRMQRSWIETMSEERVNTVWEILSFKRSAAEMESRNQ